MAPDLRPITFVAVMLLIAALATTVGAAVYDNLAVLDNAALFPQSTSMYNPGFGPRRFIYGTPASPALPFPPGKGKREEPASQCSEGKHSCLDLGPLGADMCCDNDEFCFLDANWKPRCCALGSPCEDSPCGETNRLCNNTLTITKTAVTSPVTEILSTIVTPACCGRACGSTLFLCQSGFGAQCCTFGGICASNRQCLYPSTSSKAQNTPTSAACITCDSGGGCCNVGSTCTSSLVSATSTAQLCAANLTVVGNEGLSEGARVGIGVGVAVGASLIIGGITWFWIHRRRVAKSRHDGGTLVGSGPEEPDMTGPFLPGGGAMSDVTSPSSRLGMRPRLHEDGLMRDYYGPDAVHGPYTDHEDIRTPSGAYGIESRSTPGFSDQAARAANRYPDAPGDIVRPVEMGTEKERRAELGDNGSIGPEDVPDANGAAATKEKKEEQQQVAYELYGSPVTSPVPMTFQEAEGHRGEQVFSHEKVEKSGHE